MPSQKSAAAPERPITSLSSLLYRLYSATAAPLVHKAFAIDLLMRTNNSQFNRWLGHQITQTPFDLMTIQDTITEVQPGLIVETGTFRGGSAMFYGHVFDLLGTDGRIVTIDLKSLVPTKHPRATYLNGSSTSPAILAAVREHVEHARGRPVMVILDSLHTAAHVREEMELYAPFVTPGSFMLVQDGVVDRLPVFRSERPGPLPAIRDFLTTHSEFVIDHERCDRFVITDHPIGWLRRT
jgi:cephalosporin hydroxylase